MNEDQRSEADRAIDWLDRWWSRSHDDIGGPQRG